MEGAEEEGFLFLVLGGLGCGGGGGVGRREFIISNVETGPVHRCGEDGVGVPKEGGDVCEVAIIVINGLAMRAAYRVCKQGEDVILPNLYSHHVSIAFSACQYQRGHTQFRCPSINPLVCSITCVYISALDSPGGK